jgi:hypothetical protein
MAPSSKSSKSIVFINTAGAALLMGNDLGNE